MFTLKNWKPCCEQAKYIASSLRMIGLGFFAMVGYHDASGLLTNHVHGFHAAFTVFFAGLMWFEMDLLGYLVLRKGGCQ